jgi:uridine kinase
MSVAILITGYLRSFQTSLLPFLENLPDTFDIYLCIPRSESSDQFLNNGPNIATLLKNTRIKNILIDDETIEIQTLTKRESNSLLQWSRLQKLFRILPTSYETVVRCRPDVKFLCDVETFLAYFRTKCQPKLILIPLGFDVFDTRYVSPTDSYINDQIAIGSYEDMKVYCNHFGTIQKEQQPIVSERSLFKHLQVNGITTQRIDLPYNLVLSECFTFSICGDSGSGKSYLSRLIQSTLPFDKTLLFETDRYHKWERGAEQYKTYTHLNPEANHLEKLSTDAYKLRLGEDVYIVDYDHGTGKFTEPQCVKSNQYVIFCGLHTLYQESLRSIMDLKIYLDTDPELKIAWKLQRDTKERGASTEKVLSTMKAREPDYQQYIAPQRENANIVLRYLQSGLEIHLNDTLCDNIIARKLKRFCTETKQTDNWTVFVVQNNVRSEEITAAARQESYCLGDLNDSYDGVIQYLIVLFTWKPVS